MKLDSANRNFYGIVGLAAAPFLVLGVFGCGVLSITAYRVATGGPEALGHGTVGLVAGVFLAMSALGSAMAVRSLYAQWRATVRLTSRFDSARVPVPERLRAVASDARLRDVLVVDDPDAFSLTVGVRAPVVYVSTGLLDRTSDIELAAVLVHERYHVANRDPFKIALARAITRGLYLLPALGHLLDRYLAGRELSADRRAVDRCGRPALAGALLRSAGGPTLAAAGAAAAFGGADLLDLRLTQLETDTEPSLAPPSRTSVTLTAAGITAMTGGLLATAVAVDAPTVLASTGQPLDLLGGAMCAAMWIIAVRALRSRGGSTPAA